MNTCFVHIGAPKTGSTAIQRLLFENQDVLQSQDVLYPDVCLRGFGHHDLALKLNGKYPKWARACETSLEEMIGFFHSAASGKPEKIVLSSENFYLYPQPQRLQEVLTEVLPDYEVKVIVYIREQVTAHESWFNQTIKAQGYTHNIRSCIKEFSGLWDYDQNLKMWADVFGADNMQVSVYDDRVDHTLFLDQFLEKLGVVQADIQHSAHGVNARLSSTVLEFQRLFNRLPISIISKRAFHKQLIELSGSGIEGLSSADALLDKNLGDEIVNCYRNSNINVARQYFGRDDLFDHRHCSELEETVHSRLTLREIALILKWLIARNIFKQEVEKQA